MKLENKKKWIKAVRLYCKNFEWQGRFLQNKKKWIKDLCLYCKNFEWQGRFFKIFSNF